MKNSRVALALGLGLSAFSFAVPSAHAQIFGLPLLGAPATYLCRFGTSDAVPPRQLLGNLSHVLSPAGTRLPLFELVRFRVDARGNVLDGTADLSYIEGCTLPVVGGSLPPAAPRTSLLLKLKVAGVTSDEGDMACTALLGGQAELDETFDIQRATGGLKLLAVGEENLNPAPGNQALAPLQGECERQ